MATEIIVYRNPMEKIMWDFWMGPTGSGIIGFLAAAAAIVLMVYLMWVLFLQKPYNRFMWKRRQRKGIGGVNYYSRGM